MTTLEEERQLLEVARKAASMHVRSHPASGPYFEDFYADASLGVAEAVKRHDPTRGVPLLAYAYRRAQGAILDGLRNRSPLTRGQFARGGQAAAKAATPISLEQAREVAGYEPSHLCGHNIVDDWDQARRLLALCTPTERYVIVAVVMYQVPGRTVAGWLGVTESAVSQFKARGIERMRAGVQARSNRLVKAAS